MSLYGRNNQAVTANSTTTKESTTGAPLQAYAQVHGSGKGDSPVSMSANSKFGNTSAGSAAEVDVNLFQNTTPGAFVTNMAVGVFGVTAAQEAAVAANGAEQPAHAGWQIRRAGTGPVIDFDIANTTGLFRNAGAFVNGETISVGGGEVNAIATIGTNATGNITSLVIKTSGSGFLNLANTTFAYNRELHLSAIAATSANLKSVASIVIAGVDKTLATIAAAGGAGITGYTNTDVIQITDVGGIQYVIATANVSTNATGGFVTGNLTITNSGLFPNTDLAANLVFTALAANGAASNGSGATFSGTVSTATQLAGYNNTDVITIKDVANNQTVVATGSLLTDAFGNCVSANATLVAIGLFPHAEVAANLVLTVTAANGAASNGVGGVFTATLANSAILGYGNTDVITIKDVNNDQITVAVANVSTNTTGGFVSANLTIVKAGLFANTIVAANLVITVANSTGGVSKGYGMATFSGTLAAASSASANLVPVLGGRAGRVQYETLVAMGSLGAQTAAYGTPAAVANSSSPLF